MYVHVHGHMHTHVHIHGGIQRRGRKRRTDGVIVTVRETSVEMETNRDGQQDRKRQQI